MISKNLRIEISFLFILVLAALNNVLAQPVAENVSLEVMDERQNGRYTKKYEFFEETYFLKQSTEKDLNEVKIVADWGDTYFQLVKIDEFGRETLTSSPYEKEDGNLMQIGDKLYLHDYEVQSGVFKSWVIPFNETLELERSKKKLLMSRSTNEVGEFKYFNGNSNGLSYVFYPKKKKAKTPWVHIVIFNRSLKEDRQFETELALDSKTASFYWRYLDSELNFHVCLVGDRLSTKEKKRNWMWMTFGNDGSLSYEDFTDVVVDPNRDAWGPWVKEGESEFRYVGYIKEKKLDAQKAIYVGSKSYTSNSSEDIQTWEFGEKQMKYLGDEKSNFSNHSIEVLDDESILFISEVEWWGSGETYGGAVKYFDILVMRFSPDGELMWYLPVPRKYPYIPKTSKFFGSHGHLLDGGELILFLNEDRRHYVDGEFNPAKVKIGGTFLPNYDGLTMIRVNLQTGSSKRMIVANSTIEEMGHVLHVTQLKKLEENRVFFPSTKIRRAEIAGYGSVILKY